MDEDFKCVACNQLLQQVKLGGAKFPVCTNPECPRLGLLTVVHAELMEDLKNAGKEEKEKETDSKSN